jgi:hypothetical protein
MFSRISRYRELPDTVTTDSQGRTLPSKTVRLLPPVLGTFRHTVEEVDRLDHLAFKYYQQPQKWWRIVDANPEFLSPQALLGKEPIVTERFPLTPSGGGTLPLWSRLVRDLAACVGVEGVKVVEEIHLVPQAQTVAGRPDTVYVEQFERAVVVTYNQMNVSAGDLASIMTAAGFGSSQPERLGRLGKQIIIPRDVIG